MMITIMINNITTPTVAIHQEFPVQSRLKWLSCFPHAVNGTVCGSDVLLSTGQCSHVPILSQLAVAIHSEASRDFHSWQRGEAFLFSSIDIRLPNLF